MVVSEYAEDVIINNDSKNGLIMFHGIAGNAYEHRPLVEQILPGKLDIFVPVLPHHGKDFNNLEGTKIDEFVDWGIAYTENKLENYENLFVYGLSMGAIIAALTSLQINKVRGLILSCLPLSITKKALFFDMLRKITKVNSIKYVTGYLKQSDFYSNEYIIWRKKNLDKISLDIVLDIHSNLKDIVEKYTKISKPILLFFGCKDPIINSKESAQFIHQNTQSNIKHIYMLDKCNHWIHFGKSIYKMSPIINEYLTNLIEGKYSLDRTNVSFQKI
jgi:esterase/lipase